MSLLKSDPVFKPFKYPWAYDAWKIQQQIHWIADEVPMSDDIQDWKKNLTQGEKYLLTQIFRFFTQADIEVNNCYMKKYSQVFEPVEIQMMLSAFSNIETVHMDAYSHLLTTVGMPEIEYQAFHKYKEMKDKYDYIQGFNVDSKAAIAKTLAAFGAFTEGLQLFASFAMLLNFQRFGKMKGMCQIVAWSVRDETLHTNSICRLFRTFLLENPEILNDRLKSSLYDCCKTMVEHEDAFIDLAFSCAGNIEGISSDSVKKYIRFIANRRLNQLGLKKIYQEKLNPLPWIEELILASEHVNFFENRVTEYAKAATRGTWSEAFNSLDAYQSDI